MAHGYGQSQTEDRGEMLETSDLVDNDPGQYNSRDTVSALRENYQIKTSPPSSKGGLYNDDEERAVDSESSRVIEQREERHPNYSDQNSDSHENYVNAPVQTMQKTIRPAQ